MAGLTASLSQVLRARIQETRSGTPGRSGLWPARLLKDHKSEGCPLSLQHNIFQVLLQDGVLHSVKHEADVLGVYGGGEVVEEWLTAIPPLPVETLDQVALDVLQPVGVALEVWEVLLDADSLYFLHQEVHLVEEQDDGDVEEELVVNDGLKDVHGFHQAVGAPVLHEDLVVLTGRDHEQDRRDPVEALEPLLALRPLAAHIHHLERDFFDDKVMLHDALGGLPRQQDVLLAREVIL